MNVITTTDLGSMPDWFNDFSTSLSGIILAFIIVIAVGYLASLK